MNSQGYEYGTVVDDKVTGCNYLRRKVRKPFEHRDVEISNTMRSLTAEGDCIFGDALINGTIVRVYRTENGSPEWHVYHQAMKPAPVNHRVSSNHQPTRHPSSFHHEWMASNNDLHQNQSRQHTKSVNDIHIIIKKTKRLVRPDAF